MSKLIPMDEAANILGMTVEQLTELRSNNEIFGYRDGSNWKFKMTELERVAQEMDIKLNLPNGGDVAADLSESFGFDLSAESGIDVSTEDGSTSGLLAELESSDYLEEDSSIEIKNLEKDSALRLDDSGDISLSDDNAFDGDDELSFGSSSLSLASGSSKKMPAGDDSANLLDDEPEKGESSSDTGKMLGENGENDILLSEDDLFSDELSLSDSASFEDSAELSSDFEDSELILDDSNSSSEVMLEANQSGISLGDEPLELGGSDIDALELPEDDDMIVLDNAADPGAATLMQEDDFNLTPLEASMDEDDSSGSQVIALEDSEIYADDSASTILGGSDDFGSQPAMLDDAGFDGGMGYDDGGMGGMMAPGGVAVGPAALPEAPYSLPQVLGLGLVATLLLAGSMVAYNLAQNMWMPEDQIIGNSVLNFFLRLVGMN
ncbi:MAG: hypothetical protein ACI87E_003590 [Mariniblastus sp.]|jgi:hypothetical protein